MPFDPVQPERSLTQFGQLFLDAAQQIRQHGHAKGVLQDGNGSVCMAGAMLKVATGVANSIWHPEMNNYDSWCTSLGFGSGHEMCEWNNAPERTVEEVLQCFESHAYVPA